MATGTISNDLYAQTFSMPAFTVTPGAPGTFQTTIDLDVAKPGYQIISTSLYVIGHPGTYLAVPTAYGGRVVVVIIRATTISTEYTYSSGDIKVIVAYRKT